MSTPTIAGLLLIAVPLAFNAAFATLAARFDYPDIVRRPTAEVLAKFRAGGTALALTWWAFALTAVLMVPLVVLLSRAIDDADPTLLAVATTVGVLAALVQFLGLVRWPFVIPYLARTDADPDASAARREAVDIVFQALNRYLGVAFGEHLGYLLTGAWTTLTGFALTQTTAAADWVAVPGIVIGPALMLCSLEFVGSHEPAGWKLAERLTPIAYVAWSRGSLSPASRYSPRAEQSDLARSRPAVGRGRRAGESVAIGSVGALETDPRRVAPGSRVGRGSR